MCGMWYGCAGGCWCDELNGNERKKEKKREMRLFLLLPFLPTFQPDLLTPLLSSSLCPFQQLGHVMDHVAPFFFLHLTYRLEAQLPALNLFPFLDTNNKFVSPQAPCEPDPDQAIFCMGPSFSLCNFDFLINHSGTNNTVPRETIGQCHITRARLSGSQSRLIGSTLELRVPRSDHSRPVKLLPNQGMP